jgi:hypothetical protein
VKYSKFLLKHQTFIPQNPTNQSKLNYKAYFQKNKQKTPSLARLFFAFLEEQKCASKQPKFFFFQDPSFISLFSSPWTKLRAYLHSNLTTTTATWSA